MVLDFDKGRDRRIADLLAWRLRCFACWRGVQQGWPGGVVPIGTAARMLGVSGQRLRGLVAAGRVPAFTLPTGSPHDRIVPVDVLMGLGSPLDSGRGRDHHLPATDARIGGVSRNAWAEAVAAAVSLTKYPNAALSLDDSQHKQA